MPLRTYDSEQFGKEKIELPQRASEFVLLVQSLIDAERDESDAAGKLLGRYNEVMEHLDEPEVFQIVVTALAIMEQSLARMIKFAEDKKDKPSKERVKDLKREIAILYSFLADYSDEFGRLTSIHKLLELEDDDECVLAALAETMVKYVREKEELTDEDDDLLSLIEDLADDFVEANPDSSFAYKIRSDVTLASAIFQQKSGDSDEDEVEELIGNAKQDALRAVSIDYHGGYRDEDIRFFRLRFPDLVDEILRDDTRWRRV